MSLRFCWDLLELSFEQCCYAWLSGSTLDEAGVIILEIVLSSSFQGQHNFSHYIV
jgi:hypothetical protein